MADQKSDDVSVSDNAITQKVDEILAEVSYQMRAQHLACLVKPFNGNPRDLREWISSISHYQRSMNSNDAELCKLAYETSRGIASKMIEQYASANPHCSWEMLRTELIEKLTPYSAYEFLSPEEIRQGRKRPCEPQGKETVLSKISREEEEMDVESS